jgi:hypothetical protein
MTLAISDLIVTQQKLRYDTAYVLHMAECVRSGGRWTLPTLHDWSVKHNEHPSPLVWVTVFEDGKKYIHDGHHRCVSTLMGGRDVLYEDEYQLHSFTYSQYMEPNLEKGWCTPFDPRTEVRLADFGDWRKNVLALPPEEAVKVILAEKHRYAEPRRFNDVVSLACE